MAQKINSRAKGACGERELAGLFHDHLGIRLERKLDQCRGGGHDLVVAEGQEGPVTDYVNMFAIEVKRHGTVTRGKIDGWWNQAVEQAKAAGKLPLLAYRGNRADWRFLVPVLRGYAEISREQFFFMARETSILSVTSI